MSDMAIERKPRKITVSEYYRMAEVGILDPRERVELLDGAIVEMSPLGTAHSLLHGRIVRYLFQRLGDRASTFGMASVTLGEFNEPQPDIIVGDPRFIDSYERLEHRDIFALIEISDSSIRTDMGFKRDLYASHGVREYLVVDVKGLRLHRFYSPECGAYSVSENLSQVDTFALVAIPDITIDVAAFLPPTPTA